MTGPLLIDTCALLWLSGVTGEKNVGRADQVLNAARRAQQTIALSPITAWEVGMLAAKGRLPLAMPVRTWLDRVAEAAVLSWAKMPIEVLLASSALPGKAQGDPADRIIIATAREYGLRIVTRNRKILEYAEKGHVMALAC